MEHRPWGKSLGARWVLLWAIGGIPLTYMACSKRLSDTQIIENKQFISSMRCGECHSSIYDEWFQSAHAHAWQNPHIRAASLDFTLVQCRVCHSAEPILLTGPGALPVFRPHHEEESIGCLTCHGLERGVAAARAGADRSAFCRPRQDPRIASVELCGSCHNVTHFVVDEWRDSPFARRGIDCASCHMPEVLRPAIDGRAALPGHSHLFPGHRDKMFLKSAIAWEARFDKGPPARLEVAVENRAGHNFPGEFPDREFHIVAEFALPGDDVHVSRTILKPPPRSARSLSRAERAELDNRLRPAERRPFFFDIPAFAAGVRVRLIYKRFPTLYDGEGDLLGEWHGAVAAGR